MTVRWMIAGAAALALALLTLPIGLTSFHAHAHVVPGSGERLLYPESGRSGARIWIELRGRF